MARSNNVKSSKASGSRNKQQEDREKPSNLSAEFVESEDDRADADETLGSSDAGAINRKTASRGHQHDAGNKDSGSDSDSSRGDSILDGVAPTPGRDKDSDSESSSSGDDSILDGIAQKPVVSSGINGKKSSNAPSKAKAKAQAQQPVKAQAKQPAKSLSVDGKQTAPQTSKGTTKVVQFADNAAVEPEASSSDSSSGPADEAEPVNVPRAGAQTADKSKSTVKDTAGTQKSRFRVPPGFASVNVPAAFPLKSFLSRESLAGKELWHIIAPPEVAVSSIAAATFVSDQAGSSSGQIDEDETITSRKGIDYVFVNEQDRYSARRAYAPSAGSNTFSPLRPEISRTIRLRQKAASQEPAHTGESPHPAPNERPLRPAPQQPPGLRMRYRPFGVITEDHLSKPSLPSQARAPGSPEKRKMKTTKDEVQVEATPSKKRSKHSNPNKDDTARKPKSTSVEERVVASQESSKPDDAPLTNGSAKSTREPTDADAADNSELNREEETPEERARRRAEKKRLKEEKKARKAERRAQREADI